MAEKLYRMTDCDCEGCTDSSLCQCCEERSLLASRRASRVETTTENAGASAAGTSPETSADAEWSDEYWTLDQAITDAEALPRTPQFIAKLKALQWRIFREQGQRSGAPDGAKLLTRGEIAVIEQRLRAGIYDSLDIDALMTQVLDAEQLRGANATRPKTVICPCGQATWRGIVMDDAAASHRELSGPDVNATRLRTLYEALPFQQQMRFGGDFAEFCEGLDAWAQRSPSSREIK